MSAFRTYKYDSMCRARFTIRLIVVKDFNVLTDFQQKMLYHHQYIIQMLGLFMSFFYLNNFCVFKVNMSMHIFLITKKNVMAHFTFYAALTFEQNSYINPSFRIAIQSKSSHSGRQVRYARSTASTHECRRSIRSFILRSSVSGRATVFIEHRMQVLTSKCSSEL